MSEPTSEIQAVTTSTSSTRLTILILLVTLLVGFQAWQVFQGSSTRAQAWEYTIVTPADEDLPKELGRLGLAGWEIVSSRRATHEENGKTTGIYELIMRRPAQDLASSLPKPPAP